MIFWRKTSQSLILIKDGNSLLLPLFGFRAVGTRELLPKLETALRGFKRILSLIIVKVTLCSLSLEALFRDARGIELLYR